MDFKGPFPNGYYVLVFLDVLTRWLEISFTKTTSFEAVKEPTLKWIANHGCPLQIRHDSGSPFQSAAWKQFTKEQGFISHPNTINIQKVRQKSKDV